MTDLTGKRVLILGAETEIGRAVTTAVAEAGAIVAAVAATSDADAAFTVQRLARRLSSDERTVWSQATDSTNETGVRVMMRQISKRLGGLDAVVLTSDSGEEWLPGRETALRIAKKIVLSTTQQLPKIERRHGLLSRQRIGAIAVCADSRTTDAIMGLVAESYSG